MSKRAIRNLFIVVLAIVYIALGIGLGVNESKEAALIRQGDRGNTVVQIQTKLKRWGYYNGNVDGIFGQQTLQAVRWFQEVNGVAVDGIVGPDTAVKMGITLPGSSSGTNNTGDVYLLARCIYAESRGESYTGQVAVGAVILNRVKHASFPNSISGVIYQPGAFSVVNDGQINLTPDETALRAARDAMNGSDPSGSAIYYYNPAKTSNKWMLSRPVTTTIGRHRFCK